MRRAVLLLLLATACNEEKKGEPQWIAPAPQFYFRLRAGNGEVVLSSEGYSERSSATRAVSTVRALGKDRGAFEVFAAQDGKYGLRLVAGNGEVVARGETYASKSNAERAADRIVEMLSDGVSAQTDL